MKFSWNPPARPDFNRKPPSIKHVLYEYDGPKLVLAVDDRGRQVIGVFVDEIPEGRIERWVYAPATPQEVLSLLEGASLLKLFTQGFVSVFDFAPSGESYTNDAWEVEGASLRVEDLPEPDATLPELTTEARDLIRTEQRHIVEEQQRLARTALLFEGRPVLDRRGISAAFGAEVIARYQELISMAYATRRKGFLSPTGPIPLRDESTLYLVDMPRSSVGFALQEMPSQGQTTPTGLAEAVADVGSLVDAAAAGDQELAEVIADFGPRVASTLGKLYSAVHEAGATFRLVANDKTYRFDGERVRLAAERTAVEPAEEPDHTFTGALTGFMPDGRLFEFFEVGGATIRGRISREADLGEIRQWFEKPGVAHMRVVTVKRAGRESRAYTLLRIEPPQDAQS